MSFPKYPEYKDSGVEWLGEVPAHWRVGSFRHLIKSLSNGTTANQVDQEDGLIAVSRIETISKGEVDFSKVGYVRSSEVDKRFLLKAGDILFSHINSLPMIGNTAVYVGGKPLLHGMNLLRIQPEESVVSSWVAYWLKSKNIRQEVESRAKPAINQASISTGAVKSLPALIPPESEQRVVTSFLDYETARIDALVEEQQRLIELLKEKRQAVISHAVTKGLEPDVLMKDSGVEWLGEVPAHWEVVPLKFIVSTPVTDGPHETPEFIDDGVPFVSAEAVSSGKIDFDKARFIGREDHERFSRKYSPKKHDVYMVKSGATTGITAIVEDVREFNIWSPLAVVRCKDGVDPYFVLHCMRSTNFQESVVLNWSYGTQQNIGMGVIENLPIAMPPENEQKEISAFLSGHVENWEVLTQEAFRAVSLLQERRSALISAAVTGKIDVRGWQPPAVLSAPADVTQAEEL